MGGVSICTLLNDIHKAMENEMKNKIVRCSRRGYNLLKKKFGGAKRVPPNYIHFSRDTGAHLVPYRNPKT